MLGRARIWTQSYVILKPPIVPCCLDPAFGSWNSWTGRGGAIYCRLMDPLESLNRSDLWEHEEDWCGEQWGWRDWNYLNLEKRMMRVMVFECVYDLHRGCRLVILVWTRESKQALKCNSRNFEKLHMGRIPWHLGLLNIKLNFFWRCYLVQKSTVKAQFGKANW